ncbi:MAG TPA: M23 family metallopeptidase [Sedimentisphaerales bacterium]|nr:M23 family metallopeptidase [Sedimentisphaerales bacterium]
MAAQMRQPMGWIRCSGCEAMSSSKEETAVVATNPQCGKDHPAIAGRAFLWAGFLLSAACAGLVLAAERPGRRDEAVSVRRVASGDGVNLIVENHAPCDVTVTMTVDGSNVRVNWIRPETEAYPAGSETEAVRIVPENPSRPCSWRFHFKWVKGNLHARHKENTLYLLPFEAGRSFRISQGYNGTLTHFDQDQYAVDFAMREGTAVCAARSGIVVDLEESYKIGGPSKKYKSYVNFVSIAHDDGTIAEYHHIRQNGVLVEIGQEVEAGQRIALSGNTGYSTIPHLHFGVYSPVDGKRLRSHPVAFATRQGIVTDPVEGRTYTALPAAR